MLQNQGGFKLFLRHELLYVICKRFCSRSAFGFHGGNGNELLISREYPGTIFQVFFESTIDQLFTFVAKGADIISLL